MANNSIVTIKYGETATKPVFQWDYGQTLTFEGFGDMLPDVGFEVHFANPADETSVTSIGTADGVIIPDALLQTGLSVIVWVYLHDTATDGETEYRFMIPVARRAMPDNGEVTPEQADVIDQAIAALQSGVSRAETAAENAEASETAAAASAAAAAGSASSAYSDAERAENAAGAAEGFAQSASESEGAAQGYAAAADGSAEDAESWAVGQRDGADVPSTDATYENNSKYYSQRSEAFADGTIGGEAVPSSDPAFHNNAKYYAGQAESFAQSAASDAESADRSAEAAESSASDAQSAQRAAETAQRNAELAESAAESVVPEMEALVESKQDKLTEGYGIHISEQNEISTDAFGDGLEYDDGSGELSLTSGGDEIASVTIRSTGDYSLAYNVETGRLSLLVDGAEVSYVILSGLPVTITREGDVLHVNNVPAISSIAQTDDNLVLS